MAPSSRVVIVGAGDHGRGTLEILLASRAAGADLEVLGFVDDNPAKTGLVVGGAPVLGGVGWLEDRAHDVSCVIGIAACSVKKTLADQLDSFGIRYVSAIHPSAVIGRGTVVNPGAIIGAGVVVAYDSHIGEHTTINLNATVGHDCVLSRYSTVAPGANIAGRVVLGEGCDVSLNATIAKGLSVGAWCVIGPGCVVLSDISDEQCMFGNPARRVLLH